MASLASWRGKASGALVAGRNLHSWQVLQVQGSLYGELGLGELHGELGLGELQEDSREEEHVHELENLGWGRGGLQGYGLQRKALWGDLEDDDEHDDGALVIMPP